ncbi:MAG TPA: PhzF family phenazine biosynthesis protein [Terriglobales bacterium]|nr:PhzF family phenazine biosynthesis protein [Terriglobales bacterium]
MKRRYVTADVFAERMFGGNPVAMVLDAEGLSLAQMQAIAMEFNYSETTFVLPASNPANTAWIRIFTPRAELPFAGHPNVGTAFLLAKEREAQGATQSETFVFEEAAGLVPLRLLREDGVVVGAELRAPEPLSCRAQVPTERAAQCLSVRSEDVRVEVHPPQVVSVGLPFLVVELTSREALRRTKPNLAAYEGLLPLDGADAIYAYWRGSAAGTSTTSFELYARMFAPLDGIVEDPATGSATAATLALLATVGNERASQCTWRVHQGIEMGRPSLMIGRTVKQDGSVVSVYVGGRCIAVTEGTLVLEGNAERPPMKT